ncbi:serine/threonine-protein kinase VRK3 isoform X2 [Stigmatopora nigra]
MEGALERKSFRFCPQCGSKLKSTFKFCPSCGEKIPCGADGSTSEDISSLPNFSPPKGDEPNRTNQASSICHEATDGHGSLHLARPFLRKTRNSLRQDREAKSSVTEDSPPRTEDNSMPSPTQSPLKRVKKAPTPESLPILKSPRSGRGLIKGKKLPPLERLEEGEELMDTTGRKWTLVKLLSQSVVEIVYEVAIKGSRSSKESAFILKLGSERGTIYKEQNFLQRAAKPLSVAKWTKQHELDFLGIPSCVGFGLTDSYRFLIFPCMGHSLESLMNDKLLPEKTVLHLACRILDVLYYIHSNEYVHADINADNIYIRMGQNTEVYLVGYHHASRYCPSGRHVSYRQGSQEPHEGSLEFISVDCHQGAVPSRRSDLQSLGYCMLRWHTGALPWSAIVDPDQVANLKERYLDDIPALLSHCFGRNKISGALGSYMKTVAELQYAEQPDYAELKTRLGMALSNLGGSVQKPLSF